MKKYHCINLIKHTTSSLLMRMGIAAVTLFSGTVLLAQENVVTGTVSDASSQRPLFGVRIETASQTASAITDADGSFSMKVASLSEVLIVSAPDYALREVPLQGRQSVDIQLYSALFNSGYGTMESLTGIRRKMAVTQAGSTVTDFSVSTRTPNKGR